jgi:hypothetical protein
LASAFAWLAFMLTFISARTAFRNSMFSIFVEWHRKIDPHSNN